MYSTEQKEKENKEVNTALKTLEDVGILKHLIDVGTKNNPYMVTIEENNFMLQFKEENPNRKPVYNGAHTKMYQKWKKENIIN